ncbi:hypothetical protein BDW22DRAFT_1426526 [Trametopsis cervina]|nr:hypothetical protein BDW22DRAFT_1426526 [Trametopsis cervina]
MAPTDETSSAQTNPITMPATPTVASSTSSTQLDRLANGLRSMAIELPQYEIPRSRMHTLCCGVPIDLRDKYGVAEDAQVRVFNGEKMVGGCGARLRVDVLLVHCRKSGSNCVGVRKGWWHWHSYKDAGALKRTVPGICMALILTETRPSLIF